MAGIEHGGGTRAVAGVAAVFTSKACRAQGTPSDKHPWHCPCQGQGQRRAWGEEGAEIRRREGEGRHGGRQGEGRDLPLVGGGAWCVHVVRAGCAGQPAPVTQHLSLRIPHGFSAGNAVTGRTREQEQQLAQRQQLLLGMRVQQNTQHLTGSTQCVR